jgi:hypothetical protein
MSNVTITKHGNIITANGAVPTAREIVRAEAIKAARKANLARKAAR